MDRDELLALDRGPLVELIVRLHERVAALEMNPMYDDTRSDIERRLRGSFEAAAAFGRHLAPEDPSLVHDLGLHWEAPEPFAAAAEWLNLSGDAEGLGC